MTLRNEIVEVGELDAGWAKFPIKFKNELKEGDEELLGCVDFDKYEIHLQTKQEPPIMRRTLFHECVHVFLSLTGVKHEDEDVNANLSVTNEYVTEQVVRSILLMKKLNPELWAIIVEEDE